LGIVEENGMDISATIFVVVVAYLLGATPSGYLAGMACGIDVRTAGSGNIGATNVLRVLGKKAGAIVLLADAFKGFMAARWVPVLALQLFPAASVSRENLALTGGVAAILGHIYTFWLKFKGGKGIATTCGVVLAWVPVAGLLALAVWGLVLAASKYVSLASITAAIILPLAVRFGHGSITMTCAATGLSLLVIYKHKANIERLLKGQESRLGRKKT
jgi:glycerol-3-phosphate acyltransferase PlsY